MINTTKILLIGGLVYIALQIKKQNTRNLILIITGLLAFCMLDIKEGFTDISGEGVSLIRSGSLWEIIANNTSNHYIIHTDIVANLETQAAATSRGVSPTPVSNKPEISCTIGGDTAAGHVVWKLADFNNPQGSLDGSNIEHILQCLDDDEFQYAQNFVVNRGEWCGEGAVPDSTNDVLNTDARSTDNLSSAITACLSNSNCWAVADKCDSTTGVIPEFSCVVAERPSEYCQCTTGGGGGVNPRTPKKFFW